jgi:hypothetical protein
MMDVLGTTIESYGLQNKGFLKFVAESGSVLFGVA